MERPDYKKVTQNKLRSLLRSLDARGGDKADRELIRRAFRMADDAHQGVKRKTGEPYILHPLEVALIVARDIGLGPQSIAAALLHDVIEDSDITSKQLTDLFGDDIAQMVIGLTKIQGVFDNQATSMQSENFKKLLMSISDDVRVIIIKMADRLHNMRTLEGMPFHKQLKIASETLYIFAPLAHRMGLYNIKQEFEDLGLKYTEPDVYEELEEKLDHSRAHDQLYLKRFTNNIDSLLRSEHLKFQIKRRNKGVFSIRRKMLNQHIGFDEVYDKFAIRIIIESTVKKEKIDCWQAYSLITSVFRPNPRRLRDWITTPKANGYESLHITVMGPEGQWIEVQIRSKRMDDAAEQGYAAHWRYKEDASDSPALDIWVNSIRQAIEGQSESAIEFVDQFKLQLFTEEIFVFTPRGQMLTLPKHASPIDMAFDIHSDIGMHVLGAKVNGQLVPLSHKLTSGDQVFIITADKQHPSEEWLEWVKTPKAQSKIKTYLKDLDKKSSDRGQRMVERMAAKSKFELNQSNSQKMVNYFSVKNQQEVFLRFGSGEYSSHDFRGFIQDQTGGFYKNLLRRFKPKINLPILPEDAKRIVFGPDEVVLAHQMAPCCSPISGDNIFGYIIRDGIVVHRVDCKQAIELQGQFADRILVAKWATGNKKKFNATLTFSGGDRLGLIHEVTKLLSNELNVDIRSFHIDAAEGVFHGSIALRVLDQTHLSSLAQRIRAIQGVTEVTRAIKQPIYQSSSL